MSLNGKGKQDAHVLGVVWRILQRGRSGYRYVPVAFAQPVIVSFRPDAKPVALNESVPFALCVALGQRFPIPEPDGRGLHDNG